MRFCEQKIDVSLSLADCLKNYCQDTARIIISDSFDVACKNKELF